MSTPTRTIVVTDPSGKQTRVTQTVNFTRTATFDEVTGEITYSDWKNSEPAEWQAYAAPEVAGYTATSSVSAKSVTAETKNETVNISYTANTQTGKITYVDSDGKEVGQTTISGKTGETVKVTPEVPSGWRIVPGQDIPETITATATGVPTVVVKVERSTITVTPETPEKDIPTGPVPGDPSKNYEKLGSLTSTPTRTIVVTDPSGKQTTVTQTVNFTRTATFDEVTGEITWNNWNKDKESFNEVPSPKVSGYTASPAKVAAQTVTPNSEDLVFNVIYTKNSQTYPTIPENKPNKPQEENVSKQETKTQDKLIHEYGYKKRADGRLVDHTGHVYPASSKVKENGAIYSEKGELLSVGSRRKHELPQTGLHDNSLIAAIGSLLAGISIFGLLGGRKKKDDDK